MRWTDFSGIAPKYKPTEAAATVAHNLDLYGGVLKPILGPKREGVVLDVYGEPIRGAKRLYNADGLWIGFKDFTSVIPDTAGVYNPAHFLFIQDGALYWQSAAGVLSKTPPVRVGLPRPCAPPVVTTVAGAGCPVPDFPLQCVTDVVGECPDIPNTLANYVYTYYTEYGGCTGRVEESAPSPPTFVTIKPGDAARLIAEPLPEGVTKVRWYREVAGTTGTVYLYIGESTTREFVDTTCPEQWGEPLDTALHQPLPACIEGVAAVGDSMTLLWSGKKVWVSEPFRPHAVNTDTSAYHIPYEVVWVNTVVHTVEQATTYTAHILTKGKPYTASGKTPEAIDIREIQAWHPCLNAASVCDIGGESGYVSPYGFVVFSGTNVVNLTDNYMTEREWQQQFPHEFACAWWNERIFMVAPNRDGFILGVDPNGSQRPKNLVTHSVRASAIHAAADTQLHISDPKGNDVYAWGQGTPMWWVFRTGVKLQNGLWRPSAVKVVGRYSRRRYNNMQAYADLSVWMQNNPSGTLEDFVEQNPQYKALYSQFLGEPMLLLSLYRDGARVYSRWINDARPLRLPRSIRAFDWAVQVEGYAETHEIHIQTSITDLTQEGGHA